MFTAIWNRNDSFSHPPGTIRLYYTVQLCDKFYPRIIGFVDERNGAYQNHLVHVSPCMSVSQPTQQEGEMWYRERWHFTQFIFLAIDATWRIAHEQASYTASADHRLLTCNFIHIYPVLTIIEIQMRYTVKHNTLMSFNSCMFRFISLKTNANMERSNETSLMKELHVTNFLMILKFCTSDYSRWFCWTETCSTL